MNRANTHFSSESLAWAESMDLFVRRCHKVVRKELKCWAHQPQVIGQVPLSDVVITGGDYADIHQWCDVFGFTLLAGRRFGGRNRRRRVCGSIVCSPNQDREHPQYVCCGLSDGTSFEALCTEKGRSWDVFQSGKKLGRVWAHRGDGQPPRLLRRKVVWSVDIDGRLKGTVDKSSRQGNVFVLRTESGEKFPIRIWDPSSMERTFRFTCWVVSGMWLFRDFGAENPMLNETIDARLSSTELEQLFALSMLFRFLIYFQNPSPPGSG